MADRSYLAGLIPPPTAGATVNNSLNLFDLSSDDFRSYLNELAAQGVNTDELMRQYRRANSPFAGLFDWAINSERDIANEGRTTAGAGLFSKEAGTTGMDALASTRIEPANFIAGLLSGGSQAIDAAGATLKGLIPASDMPMEALGTAGMAMTGGAASMGRGVFDYDPNTTRSFSDYLSKVNPQGYRVDANDRPNLMMGDMYGMLPRDARKVGERDGVLFYQAPDGASYATAFNPDVGEMDVVGYAMPRGDMTDLAVVNEMQGRGIGSELQYLMRSRDPYALTGGLTEAGEASLRRTYNRLRDEGIVSANRDATTGAIVLPAARNEAERMARDILELRAAGRASEVTDAMMAQADPQYMFNNTPLPMDEVSRMARAREMGLLDDAYHATGAEFQQFIPSQVGRHGAGVYTGKNAADVQTFLPKDEVTRRYAEGSQVLPLRIPDDAQMASEMKWQDALPERWNYGDPKDVYDAISGYGEAADVLSQAGFKGVTQPATDWDGRVIFDPTQIRSRFARFDPEFSHLANLNAANASPLAGILAMPNEEERNRQLGMLFGGYR